MGEDQDPQHLELLPYQIEIRNSTSGEGRSGGRRRFVWVGAAC